MSTTPDTSAVHERFSWLHKSMAFDREAQFTSTAVDVCKGIALCLELAHTSNMERDNNDQCDPGTEGRPTLGVVDTEHLLMFATAAARLLAAAGEDNIDYLNKAAVAAERGGHD